MPAPDASTPSLVAGGRWESFGCSSAGKPRFAGRQLTAPTGAVPLGMVKPMERESQAGAEESKTRARPPHERWGEAQAGCRYARDRWRDSRRAARDPRLVERLLAGAKIDRGTILDAPCGTGRLLPGLAQRATTLVGLDVSDSMLAEAKNDAALTLRGDVHHLPFADGTFDAVVCCRLLHHLADPADLAVVVAELVRVSRGVVVASFWDRASLPGVRRHLRPRSRAGRAAHTKRDLHRVFAAAGADVVRYAHSFRFLSQQTFLLAETRR